MTRKDEPLFTGALRYFPDALRAVSRLSKLGNDKHNAGEPLHWAREKSNDHADCVTRHLADAFEEEATSPCGARIGISVDPDTGMPHAIAAAWRALAHAQLVCEWRARTTRQFERVARDMETLIEAEKAAPGTYTVSDADIAAWSRSVMRTAEEAVTKATAQTLGKPEYPELGQNEGLTPDGLRVRFEWVGPDCFALDERGVAHACYTRVPPADSEWIPLYRRLCAWARANVRSDIEIVDGVPRYKYPEVERAPFYDEASGDRYYFTETTCGWIALCIDRGTARAWAPTENGHPSCAALRSYLDAKGIEWRTPLAPEGGAS